MALNSIIIILSTLVLLCMASLVSSHNRRYTAPNVTRVTDMFGHVSIDQAFNKLYGASNIVLSNNASSVSISLDKNTGAGLVSRNKYEYGFFSAAIKLPAGLTSGVVLAFYLSNAETYPHNHDEIDIELLGHDKRRDWAFQTNVYANGSVRTGREEKFYLWFDPTEQYHYYSILWNTHHIVFFVDNIPVREFPSKIASVYPSKPMSVYATIWDGSEWATHGGKYPVNYEYAPFVARFAEMQVVGCVADSKQPSSSCPSKASTTSGSVGGPEFAVLSKQQSSAMAWARSKLMFYSYCKDTVRYKVLPPECN